MIDPIFKRLMVAAFVAMLAVPSSAAAAGEFFGGYSFLRQRGDDARNLHGGNAAISWDVSGRLAIVLDASGHRSSSNGTTYDQLTLAGGPSLTFARRSRVRPFFQVLVGAVKTSTGIKVFDVSISETHTGFGGQAGGGLDVRIGERWALRALQAEVLVRRADGLTEKGLRLSAGAVYRFGAR